MGLWHQVDREPNLGSLCYGPAWERYYHWLSLGQVLTSDQSAVARGGACKITTESMATTWVKGEAEEFLAEGVSGRADAAEGSSTGCPYISKPHTCRFALIHSL